MLVEDFVVQSPNVAYSDDYITSTYNYASTRLERSDKGGWVVQPTSTEYQFRVNRRVPKLGCAAAAPGIPGTGGAGGGTRRSAVAAAAARAEGLTQALLCAACCALPAA